MISPERLRRYRFFGFLNHTQLRAIAQITTELHVKKGETLFKMNRPAEALYFLMEGEIELHYLVVDRGEPGRRKDYLVGIINPGEIAGISALIEPYKLTANGFISKDSHLLKIEARPLRNLYHTDPELMLGFIRALLSATMERLHSARIQLAAATNPL